MTRTESELQIQIADYLRLQYPDVMFHSDFGSGIKLTPGQATKQKRQNGGRRAWPDMFIAKTEIVIPANIADATKYGEAHWVCFGHQKGEKKKSPLIVMAGLFLELKKEGTRLEAVHCKPKDPRRSMDGKVYATIHLKEQADLLYDLRQCGYCAEFAVGFDEAKEIIDKYLGGLGK